VAEYSEWLVAKQLGAVLSTSRVQKGYDMIGPDGRKIQVRYLANPSTFWRNEHHIRFTAEMDDYAVVFYEGMELRAAIIFRRETLAAVCSKLKKRHPSQWTVLQLTRLDYLKIVGDSAGFESIGVRCYMPKGEPA
jgi:hypothetical protein